MATGGMGDVLSGIIGGLLAQGVNQNHCLALAVCLHAEAAIWRPKINKEVSCQVIYS